MNYPVLIAPLAGITDAPFRRVLRALGADLCFTEMISAKGLVYGNRQTLEYLSWPEDDKPLGVQIFGSEAEIMVRALQLLQEKVKFEELNVNMGCPVRKVVQNGDGCMLMGDIEKAADMMRRLRRETDKTLSVKMRLGLKGGKNLALDLALAMQDAGVDRITLHGRFADQMYSGKADWEAIASVKKQLRIPLIGNGDVFSLEDYIRTKKYGTDGVMLARGILGNPFLVAEIKAFEEGETISFSVEEKMKWLLQHLHWHVEMKGAFRIAEFRTHAMNYTKGMRGSAQVRRDIASASSREDFESLCESLVEKNP